MERYGTQIMSWAPVAEGVNDFFSNELLATIGAKYTKCVEQTALRYYMQRNIVVIPKSSNKERMIQNLEIFDFELSEDEMKQITTLDTGTSLFFSHYDPKTVEMMMEWEKAL